MDLACAPNGELFFFHTMGTDLYDELSRLERRIMNAIYVLGNAPVSAVVEELGDEENYHSIRVTMANLEKKGFLTHRREGTQNVYAPKIKAERARESAMDSLMRTFFDDSPAHAILGFLDRTDTGLSEEDVAEIRARIQAAEESRGEG